MAVPGAARAATASDFAPAADIDEEYALKLAPFVQMAQRYKNWCETVPLFYRTLVQLNTLWPAVSAQLYPCTVPASPDSSLLYHGILYGTQTSGDGRDTLLLCAAVVENTSAAVQLPQRHNVPPVLHNVASFRHTGDVDRLRYCPSDPTLVAAKCAGAGLSLYDISAAVESLRALDVTRAGGSSSGGGGGGSSRSSALDSPGRTAGASRGAAADQGGGSGDGEGTGIAASGGGSEERLEVEEGRVEFTDEEYAALQGPLSVLEDEEQEGMALAWGATSAGGGAGAGNSGSGGAPGWAGLRLFSGVTMAGIGEYGVREDGSLYRVCVRRGGHDADGEVSDLATAAVPAATAAAEGWAWRGSGSSDGSGGSVGGGGGDPLGLLASVGTDGRCLLWDTRQRAVAAAAPRLPTDLNGVALSAGSAAPLVAAGGDDGIVRVYDVRRLAAPPRAAAGGRPAAATDTATAACAPLHRLKGHRCKVLQLSFSPHDPLLLASSDEQGRVLLWNLGAAAEPPSGAVAPPAAAPSAAGVPASGQAGTSGPPTANLRAPSPSPSHRLLQCRPQLAFVHAGHMLPVNDFGWSTALYGTLLSTSTAVHVDVAREVCPLLQLHEDDLSSNRLQVGWAALYNQGRSTHGRMSHGHSTVVLLLARMHACCFFVTSWHGAVPW